MKSKTNTVSKKFQHLSLLYFKSTERRAASIKLTLNQMQTCSMGNCTQKVPCKQHSGSRSELM